MIVAGTSLVWTVHGDLLDVLGQRRRRAAS